MKEGMKVKVWRKFDYEILFKDSPEYFMVPSARMIQLNGPFVRFVCFDETGESRLYTEWYPVANIHRIKRYEK